ncbi:MAG TPA: STAS domain-containing protein [Bacillus bacterium]|nr:STAS domain-containing protein [Bacillus sp. (in: firmicutes)]
MFYQINAQADQVFVTLSKEIYVDQASSFREALLPYLEKGYKNFIIDVSNLSYIDSSGLGVLIGIQKRAITNGGKVTIKGLKGPVKELFELTRLTKIFEIIE